jgi:molecular chaperone GrpE
MTNDGGNGGVKDDAAPDGPDAPAATDEETGLAPVDGTPVPPASAEEVAALRRELDALREQLLRRRADFENFRKRVERDRTQAGVDAQAALLQALIPSLDNLDRALAADVTGESLRQGVELIGREIQTTLEAQGVVVDDPLGRHFDPETHQALSHEPAAGVEDGTVLEVFRKGYSLKGRLLRPALVKVAKGQKPATSADADDPEAIH